MPAKLTMIEQIGERGLLLPGLIAGGLAAHDRVTYYMALLQAARAYALSSSQQPVSNLRVQREASGVLDPSLDHVVEASVSRGNKVIYIPGAFAIIDQLFQELRGMVAVLHTAGGSRPDIRDRAEVYQHRLDSLRTTVPASPDDQVADGTITVLTSSSKNGHDTVHQLIMDLHGELTGLLGDASAETIDGASAYGLIDRDRALVRAFMSGVNETAALKFDHPGLTTTAARDGTVLSIQNDLELTDAHVIVLHVEGLEVTITYTDVHHARVRFFRSVLQTYPVAWSADRTAPAGAYEIAVGKHTAGNAEQLERYLRFLGSRLVFLIDWNRTRKELGRLIGRSEAVGLLKWAADHDVGHRAFLQIGGSQVIETAFERAVQARGRFTSRLDELLGRHAARPFLMSVLRTASAGLIAGESRRLIEDKIEAELLRYLGAPDRHVLAGAADHATMIAALAERIRQELLVRRNGGGTDAGGLPELARLWASRADEVLSHERLFVETTAEAQPIRLVLADAAEAARGLEEAAFMLPLLPRGIESVTFALIEALVDHVSASSRAYVRCLEEGQALSRSSDRTDVDAFLVTIDRVVAIGRDAVNARRALTERLVRGSNTCQELYVMTAIAGAVERAAVILARSGPAVRDTVLRTRLTR